MNPNSVEYHKWAKSLSPARYRVAAAWIDGEPARGSNYSTDGERILSYGWHVVGETAPDGRKIAYDCHYSVTTTKQTGPAKAMADDVVPCKSCGAERTHGPGLTARY